jgi:hypothetical protein
MTLKTMADVEARYARIRELSHLRLEAHHLCNALCHKLDWRHEPQDVVRINHALARARSRLARREALD